MHNVIIATNNPDKLREIKEIFSGLPFELTSLKDHWNPVPSIQENGNTFLENARAKARWVFDKTGTWSLADDSGLEVDALGGAPGVRSARFAGDRTTDRENLDKLLAALDALGACSVEKRTARFRCVVVMKVSASEELVANGVCEGAIGLAPRGTDGFGYDPVFVPAGHSKTFAEIDSLTKNAI